MNKTISQEWRTAIEAWDAWTRAEGQPSTTRRTRREHLQHLARRTDLGPWQMTGHDLLAFFASQPHWSAETRRCRRQTLQRFYLWAIGQGHVEGSPVDALPRMKPSKPNPSPCPEGVVDAAYLVADDREHLMLRLCEHGLRRGEVALVHTGRDLIADLTGTSLLVHGKGGKDRVVPLMDDTAALLRALPTGWAFPGRIDGHLSARRVGEIMTTLLGGPWTMHKLRHRAATNWNEDGADIVEIQELLGHANLNTTRAYVKVRSDRLRRVVNRQAAA